MKRKKCILLLPTAYNDGARVPPKVLKGILREIDTEFDGHTVDGVVDGTYKMGDGTFVSDKSLKVWVAVPDDEVATLKRKAAKFAKILRQESLYFKMTDAEVEFIRPLLDAGEDA